MYNKIISFLRAYPPSKPLYVLKSALLLYFENMAIFPAKKDLSFDEEYAKIYCIENFNIGGFQK